MLILLYKIPYFSMNMSLQDIFLLMITGLRTSYLVSLFFKFTVESYRSLEKNTQGQPDGVVSLAKWRILNRLHDRNETLYYRVRLKFHFVGVKEFA